MCVDAFARVESNHIAEYVLRTSMSDMPASRSAYLIIADRYSTKEAKRIVSMSQAYSIR